MNKLLRQNGELIRQTNVVRQSPRQHFNPLFFNILALSPLSEIFYGIKDRSSQAKPKHSIILRRRSEKKLDPDLPQGQTS